MPGFSFRLTIKWAALGLLLAGCGHMPVASMVKLARVDFATTDPAGLRAAVKLPAAIKPLRDRMRLRLAVRLANGKESTQDFRLTEVSDAIDASWGDQIEAGTHLFAYQLEPAEAARLVAFRDALKEQQAASGGRGGAVTISVAPGACRNSEIPTGPVLFTTYLRTAETGGYIVLARDVDLRTVAGNRDLAAEMPICDRSG
jgi:hypothetical protein